MLFNQKSPVKVIENASKNNKYTINHIHLSHYLVTLMWEMSHHSDLLRIDRRRAEHLLVSDEQAKWAKISFKTVNNILHYWELTLCSRQFACASVTR